MNKKEVEDRITLEQVMAHEYFSGVDWDNLPTYAQAAAGLTEF